MWNILVTLVPEIVAVMVKGGLIMIPLLVASLIAVTVIIERLSFWRRLGPHEVNRTILAVVAEGGVRRMGGGTSGRRGSSRIQAFRRILSDVLPELDSRNPTSSRAARPGSRCVMPSRRIGLRELNRAPKPYFADAAN